ncbi:MAG: hypothetical protein JO317_06305 [Verrucomicrobiae bacterium]|nr:hypothetical protein [Verrucomicrobiae bacterium]
MDRAHPDRIKLSCLECAKPVVVSATQPCFYCGRRYPEQEIAELLAAGKAEKVELDQLLGPSAPMPVPPEPRNTATYVIYALLALLFLLFCFAAIWIIHRLKL